MKTNEINIRDPFVLKTSGKESPDSAVYYLYGTRSATCWGEADGFDAYKSTDLVNWEGPFEIFHRPEGFFADRAYWAPECYEVDGKYFFYTTLGSADVKKGIYRMVSDSPIGPFKVDDSIRTYASDGSSKDPGVGRLTPPDETCIDGTVYEEDGEYYLVWSHSFEDCRTGDMCMRRIPGPSDNSEPGPISILFSAPSAPWAKPVPFAKKEFGIDGDVYFTDGPFLKKAAAKGDADHKSESASALFMIWSSWSVNGYAVGVARSTSGKVAGPWVQLEKPLFPENGGHGMLFEGAKGELLFLLHYPNDKGSEHPVFFKVLSQDGTLVLGDQVYVPEN